ncbi:hypothetical protein [Alcaligenes sp. SDU_A2]|uniref:hypothetical protein n=1 Tax=Alcaligenes sp. SDU_A2 TaxID=3136634 RepID=UPI002C799BE2|nr:hypothetical protein [Alcaligenes sp.]HRL26597.1 hypothetical protein [Alcaligenes sp.]
MRAIVLVIFNSRQQLELVTSVQLDEQAGAASRNWLDHTWERLGCEPLRPSGKVLVLDKIMGVADALGYGLLSQDDERAQEFARHCLQALQSSRVTVDLPGLAVTF